MVQFLSIIFFFFGFLQFLLGFSKVPVFFVSLCMLCRCVYQSNLWDLWQYQITDVSDSLFF